ncbi:hypothetical protein PMAYCL1PPCAC_13356, partial [Pristionchus mayeri]
LSQGVKTDGKVLSCVESPSLIETSDGMISSPSVVCDESTGLYKDGNKIVTKEETLKCRKLSCEEYSGLTLVPGVKTDGKVLSCVESPSLIETSDGMISSPSVVCDESTGLYKDGNKIVSKGETLKCRKVTYEEYSGITLIP